MRASSSVVAFAHGRLDPEEQLTFDIAFAFKKVTSPGFRKALSEEDRFSIAKIVVEHPQHGRGRSVALPCGLIRRRS
jgi:hypothetical protein